MWNARLRLASLWLSQVARVAADSCLAAVALFDLAWGPVSQEIAWQFTIVWLTVPAILLIPLIGDLINSLPKRPVLLGSAGLCLLAGVMLESPRIGALAWATVGLGTAMYRSTRYALTPAATQDARLSLTRVNGWMEMGTMLAILGAVLFLATYSSRDWDRYVPVVTAAWLGSLALLTTLPVDFQSDVRRPGFAFSSVRIFLADSWRVLQIPDARGCLIGLGYWYGVMLGLIGALFGGVFGEDSRDFVEAASWLLGGLAVGSFLAGCQPHLRRVLGLVPIGAVGLIFGLLLISLGVESGILLLLLGVMAGLINVPLSTTYQAIVPVDARGNAMALRYMTDALGILLVGGMLFGLSQAEILSPHGQLWLLAAIAFIAAIVSGRWLLRELLELLTELSIVPFYRVKAIGPGLDDFPMQGPLIVLSNHAAYPDPVWVAKIIPRQMIPMMTSAFFDLPVIRWLMVNVAGTIRVEASHFRREVPEIKDAVAVLDRGESLLVFPEGQLRRKEERPLRLFGQGVWHILRERPDTPVIVCWIEGNWGSYFSYRNGPPTKNKRIDIRRPIDIAVGPAQVLDRSLLEDQRATRQYLMQVCLETRRYLGLEPLTLENAGEETETNSN